MRHGTAAKTLARSVLRAILLGILIVPPAASGDEPEYPTSRLGIRTAPLLLLSRPDVRADLELSAEQGASAERQMAKLYVRAAEIKGKTGAEVLAVRRQIDEAQQRWIEAKLTEDQQKRLLQIDLQWEGPSVLVTRPLVAESLKLSKAQRTTLAKAVEERNRMRAQGRNRPADERTLAELCLSTLTAEQKAQWKEMLGRPFVPQVAKDEAATTK
jgi:hypothetical protein